MGSRLRTAEWYANEIHAEMAKARLEEAGISVVLHHDTGGIQMPWTRVHLLVREEDLERARQVLAAPAVPPSGAGPER